MPSCSEKSLRALAQLLAAELGPRDRVFLEGPMGAGKTTFARALLEALGVRQPPEGSPTFAIAHEYESRGGGVVHIDFYRLRSEMEIDEAGIPAYFWERELLVISEWASLFPDFEKKAGESAAEFSARSWRVDLSIISETDRHITVRQL